MINDRVFGPQFDPTDGTLGPLQLEKRWVLTTNHMVWPSAQAFFTYDTRGQAEDHLKILEDAEVSIPLDLAVHAWWCWPDSHFPAYRGEAEEE